MDGIDLNCGCPQSWAIESGYGCAMLRDPQLIKDLTDTVRRRFPATFSVSVKIRLQVPLSQTVDLCRQLEHCGVTFVSVHGRTTYQKTGVPSDADAIAQVCHSVGIPLVANGDVKTLSDADELFARTACAGVMSARGILANPALFGGHVTTPLQCVQRWLDVCALAGDAITFQCFQHHLTFMMDKLMARRQRVQFNDFTRKEQIWEFMEAKYGLRPREELAAYEDGLRAGERVTEPEFDESAFRERMRLVRLDEKEAERLRRRQAYSSDAGEGKFFRSQRVGGGDDDGSDSESEDDIDCSGLFGF